MNPDYDLIRHVEFDGYTLKLYDTGKQYPQPFVKDRLAYEMFSPSGELLFTGEDFGNSPMHAIDSDDTLRSLLGFLTLKPGDTDADYFKDYTPRQMEFAESEAEDLFMWHVDPEKGEDWPAFTNLDDFEG
jgi:hypothetical protein